MKKKLLKFFIIIGALGLLLTTLSVTQVQAALQANPNTHYVKTGVAGVWIKPFREMEAIGGALGLSEIIDGSLVANSSNNLDSHMVKSTEYGAAAILSASGYGNSKTLQESEIKTTTGNETGVYFGGENWEFVAGGYSGRVFSSIERRYHDVYGDKNTSAKVGDALGTASTPNPGAAGWHSASYAYWFETWAPFLRRGGTGIFSFVYSVASSYTDDYNKALGYSRGVVVCGEGL